MLPLTAKILPKIGKNREKIREKTEKRGKNWEKEEKPGRFFHFAPPDRRAGYATGPGYEVYAQNKDLAQNIDPLLKWRFKRFGLRKDL